MLKEIKSVEYALEIFRVLHWHPTSQDSKKIFALVEKSGKIDSSLSYIQKILSRLARVGLLTSSEDGYQLAHPIDEITVDMVLSICPMPEESSPVFLLCKQLKDAVSLSAIDEFYDFQKPDSW